MDIGAQIGLLGCRNNQENPVKITQVDGNHLLCLNQNEALMMASVFQASLLHEPTRNALLTRRDYAAFHHQVMNGLARSSMVQPNH